MPSYPAWSEDYPGWNVETTHPITEDSEEGELCTTCRDAVEPAILWAIDWQSVAYGNQLQDPDGTIHLIVVRNPPEEP
jgi:hypothetical protein